MWPELKVITVGAMILITTGCMDSDQGNVAPTPESAPIVEQISGLQVYEETCKVCHEGAIAKAPHRDMLSLMSPDLIVSALTSGAMQPQAAHLTDIQKAAVAEYLTGVKPGAKQVAQRMCEESESWFDYSQHPDTTGWGLDRRNTRYVDAATAGVGKESIKSMKVKWVFPFPGAVRARSQPSILGGALYTGSPDGRLYALDAESGCIHWSFQAAAEVRTGLAPQDWEGDSGGEPVLYFGDITGTVYALRADTGELIWSDKPNSHPNVTISATPLYDDGQLYLALS